MKKVILICGKNINGLARDKQAGINVKTWEWQRQGKGGDFILS
jgi:hypothetical protein